MMMKKPLNMRHFLQHSHVVLETNEGILGVHDDPLLDVDLHIGLEEHCDDSKDDEEHERLPSQESCHESE